MKKPKQVCKPNCPSREPGCHSTCEMYIEYTNELDKWTKLVRSNRDNERNINNYEALRNRKRKLDRMKSKP